MNSQIELQRGLPLNAECEVLRRRSYGYTGGDTLEMGLIRDNYYYKKRPVVWILTTPYISSNWLELKDGVWSLIQM